MKSRMIAAATAAALSLGFAASAVAQVKPDVLVKQRQAAMTLIGKYFGPTAGMASGKIPYNAQMVVRNAGYLNALAPMAWDGFDASTQGEKSRALPAIWSDAAKWNQARDAFVAAAGDLAKAAQAGDEGAIKSAVGAVGKTCGGCHDNFRSK